MPPPMAPRPITPIVRISVTRPILEVRPRAADAGSGSEAVELRRTQPQEVDEIARRPEWIADHVAGHGRERHDDRTVTLGEQHRLGRHRPVDELRQPANARASAGWAGRIAISPRSPT